MDPRGEFPLDVTSYVFHLFAVVARHRDARLEAVLKPPASAWRATGR